MDNLLTHLAQIITRDWDVTPGYAHELARQLLETLEEEGYCLSLHITEESEHDLGTAADPTG